MCLPSRRWPPAFRCLRTRAPLSRKRLVVQAGRGPLIEKHGDLEFAAELLGQVAFDPVMRAKVIAAQSARLDHFSDTRLVERLEYAISAVTRN